MSQEIINEEKGFWYTYGRKLVILLIIILAFFIAMVIIGDATMAQY
jgi:hypothetical protein